MLSEAAGVEFIFFNPSTGDAPIYDALVDEPSIQLIKGVQEGAVTAMADELNKSGHIAVYGIHFQTGDAMIMPDSMHVLGDVAKMLQQNPEVKVSVEGHTDNAGSAASNQELSDSRAQNVMAWLTSHGIDRTRLQAKGWGQSKPVADNSTEEGRAKNRRVELVQQ